VIVFPVGSIVSEISTINNLQPKPTALSPNVSICGNIIVKLDPIVLKSTLRTWSYVVAEYTVPEFNVT